MRPGLVDTYDDHLEVSTVPQFVVSWDGSMFFDEHESADDVLDRVMEQLLETDLIDPTIEYDASTGRVVFETIVDDRDPLEAVEQAANGYRASLHGAGVDTRQWVDPGESLRGTWEAALKLHGDPSVRPLVDA